MIDPSLLLFDRAWLYAIRRSAPNLLWPLLKRSGIFYRQNAVALRLIALENYQYMILSAPTPIVTEAKLMRMQPSTHEWRPGRTAEQQTALMAEHVRCVRCHDNRNVVMHWENGNAVWGPCPDCNQDGFFEVPTWDEWQADHPAAK